MCLLFLTHYTTTYRRRGKGSLQVLDAVREGRNRGEAGLGVRDEGLQRRDSHHGRHRPDVGGDDAAQ